MCKYRGKCRVISVQFFFFSFIIRCKRFDSTILLIITPF